MPNSQDGTIFTDAISRLDRAAEFAVIDGEALEKLKYPKAVLEVSIPVRMDVRFVCSTAFEFATTVRAVRRRAAFAFIRRSR